MSATALLRTNPSPTEEQIKKALQGNICRCTGYWNIFEAVKAPPGPRVSTTTVTPERVETQAPQKGWAGQSVPRKEDKRLVEGEGVFVDDIKRHGMGYVFFVRSPYAHAHITSIDVSQAEAIKGVYGTLTGEEVAALTDPFFQLSTPPGAHLKDFALAVGKVRYVGEAVVAVVAETRELARDASELVEVDYEPLAPVTDARRAEDPEAPILHEDSGSNLMWEGVYEWGDLDAAFAEADRVVKIKELHFHRFNSTPLETDGALVEYNRGTGQWTIHTNNQFPGFAAIMMGPAMRCGLDKLRFVTQDIGGGFGNKITSHPQLVVCCLLARKLNRPMQWTEWRTDFHLSMSHGNERWFHDTEVAVKEDGTLLGFRTKALDDAGAWLRYEPLGGVIWAQVTPGHVPLAQHPPRVHAGGDEQGAGLSEPRLLAHAAPLVHGARDRHRRARARPRPRRGAQAQLHPRRGHAVRDAERLRLRLGRLRADARRRARPDRLERNRGAAARRRVARQAARRRHRLHARLGHEQLRPVADDQPGAPVLGQQRGRDGEARHLRRDRRHARHDPAGPGPRDDGRPDRGRHPPVLA